MATNSITYTTGGEVVKSPTCTCSVLYKCVKYIIFDPPWSSEQLGVFGVRVGSRLGVFVVRVASVLNSDLTKSVGRP